ncbi:hypothetical protein [Streptomyces cucumeris]|uniref:hypothetical protein n=1 Tax=Streptomyces cucumeris TaxID=2962890 RepID=UPI003D70CA3E
MSVYQSVALPGFESDQALLWSTQTTEATRFRKLYLRHCRAAFAYAACCTGGDRNRSRALVKPVFTQLRALLSAPRDTRRPESVRAFLLHRIRHEAARRCGHRRAGRRIPFAGWVADGCPWPAENAAQLSQSFHQLSATDQTLLWHTTAEDEKTPLVSAISGVDRNLLPGASLLARSRLRDHYTELLIATLGNSVCMEEMSRLLHGRGDGLTDAHHSGCDRCTRTLHRIAGFDATVTRQLPLAVLGWWPGRQYFRQKSVGRTPWADIAMVMSAALVPPSPVPHTAQPLPATSRPPGAPRTVDRKACLGLAAVGLVVGMGAGYTHDLLTGQQRTDTLEHANCSGDGSAHG